MFCWQVQVMSGARPGDLASSLVGNRSYSGGHDRIHQIQKNVQPSCHPARQGLNAASLQ